MSGLGTSRPWRAEAMAAASAIPTEIARYRLGRDTPRKTMTGELDSRSTRISPTRIAIMVCRFLDMIKS